MVNKAWQGSSDIFTDYEGTISDAKFEVGQYGTQMKLVFSEIDGGEDDVFEYYSIPDTWETNDGGQTIERSDGKDKFEHPLKRSNKWQRFVMAAAACGGDKVIEELGEDAPFNAGAWIGTRWHMDAVEGKTYKDRDTGETKKAKDTNFPVEYLGKDSVAVSASSNGKVDSLSVLTTLNNPTVESQIADLAKTLDHKDWFRQAYALVTEAGATPVTHGDLISAMGTRGLYESLGGKG